MIETVEVKVQKVGIFGRPRRLREKVKVRVNSNYFIPLLCVRDEDDDEEKRIKMTKRQRGGGEESRKEERQKAFQLWSFTTLYEEH